MAQVDFYQGQLRNLLTDPNSFQQTPGFQFALNTGLQGVQRSNSRQRGSGAALAALTGYGTGLANQEYGNQVSRLSQLLGQEQGYDLGQGNLKLGNDRLALDSELGRGRLDLDRTLGTGQLDNSRRANDQQFGLGMYRAGNDFSLGSEQNANTAQNNWWNYNVNQQQNANTAAANENNYNLGQGRNAIDWFNAGTSRGGAQSQDYWKYMDWLKNNGGYA